MVTTKATSPQDRLNIYLLGPPIVVWGGNRLSIPRKHVRALLYYLAAQPEPSPRHVLYNLFWGDIPEPNSRRNLTRSLTQLRRAIPVPDLLLIEDNLVHLNQAITWCDLLEFCKISEVLPLHTNDLQRMVALYRGHFLDGFNLTDCLAFDNWTSYENSKLENIHLKNLSSLINTRMLCREYPSAIQYAKQYLQVDELSEETHRLLIYLYGITGERGKVLRQYEACAAILENELGAEPLLETRTIYQSILKDSPTVHTWVPVEFEQSPISHFRDQIPMVGRLNIIDHVERMYRSSKDTRNKFLLIAGEPGMGKTRLLRELAHIHQHHAQVIFAVGDRGERTIPYHPLVEALRICPLPAPSSLSLVWAQEFSRLYPEITAQYAPIHVSMIQRKDKHQMRLFESICQYIFALNTDYGLIVLFLDDLQWFDRTSIKWLIHFSHHLQNEKHRIMIIGTYRSDEAKSMKDLCDSLERMGLLDEIYLEGLNVAEILTLLKNTIGDQAGIENLAKRLHDATGGNPFFLIETLRTLEEDGKLQVNLNQVVDFPMPDSVRQAINRRVACLNSRSRQILKAGSILGANFDLRSTQFTAGRSEIETTISLSELINRQFLVEEENRFRFSHDLVRRATVVAIPPIRVRLLHSRAGKALEKYHPDAIHALAEHFDASCSWDKALHYYNMVAQRAEHFFAWQEEESCLTRMLEILSYMDPYCREMNCLRRTGKILEQLARLHTIQGLESARDDDLNKLESIVETSKCEELKLLSNVLQTRYLNLDGKYAQALATAEKGIILAQTLKNDNAHIHLLTQIGVSYHYLGQPALALSVLEKAKNSTDQNVDMSLIAFVTGRLGFTQSLLGNYRKALEYQQEAFLYYQEMGDQANITHCQIEIGFLYANLARFAEAEQLLLEVLMTSRKLGLRPDEAHSLLALGGLFIFRGLYHTATLCLTKSLAYFESLRLPNLATAAEITLGFAYYQLGDFSSSRYWLQRGSDRARSLGLSMRLAQTLIQLAMLEIAEGRLLAANTLLDEALTITKEIQSKELLSAGLIAIAVLKRYSGALLESLQYLDEAIQTAQSLELYTCELWARTEACLTRMELNELNAAEQEISLAESLIPFSHQRWIKFELVHLTYVEVLKRLGNAVEAERQQCLANTTIQGKASFKLENELEEIILSQTN